MFQTTHLQVRPVNHKSPTPVRQTTTENPFKQLRTKHGLTHEELSERAHISKQALIRLEQGTFEEPLPSALQYWTRTRKEGYSELKLNDAYLNYQLDQRKEHMMLFGDSLSTDPFLLSHPFNQLRLRSFNGVGANKTQICKALCLPQSTMQRWESQWRNQKTVPSNLMEVLGQIGYGIGARRGFIADFDIWLEQMLIRHPIR